MNKKKWFYSMAWLTLALPSFGQKKIDNQPQIHGTLRGKYEYQTEDKKGRFEVRSARVSISGRVLPKVEYKAEIDLCDEGKIKMLDAYTRLELLNNLHFTIGQMRVPFTIDAHRSPHLQYFANRSFIAKQVGNVRDVGCMLAYNTRIGFPITLEAGIYNGSGLTNQKDFWTNSINFSAKASMFLPCGLNVVLSAQRIKPSCSVMMYDTGVYYHRKGLHLEAEYLYKHYKNNAFEAMSSVDAFASYDIELKKGFFKYITPLLRYDYMGDHSDGILNEEGKLFITDYKRHRITGGVTLSIDKPFLSDIRINYEKYFYDKNAIPKISERDKFVIEFMTHF